ncbi:MAG: hypothetical protein ACYTFA_08550 [Planctomycetota bacterium]
MRSNGSGTDEAKGDTPSPTLRWREEWGTQPGAGPLDPDCLRCFDYDNDGNVDLFDLSVFLRLFGASP